MSSVVCQDDSCVSGWLNPERCIWSWVGTFLVIFRYSSAEKLQFPFQPHPETGGNVTGCSAFRLFSWAFTQKIEGSIFTFYFFYYLYFFSTSKLLQRLQESLLCSGCSGWLDASICVQQRMEKISIWRSRRWPLVKPEQTSLSRHKSPPAGLS